MRLFVRLDTVKLSRERRRGAMHLFEVAKGADLNVQTVGKAFAGRRVSISTARSLAKFFGVSVRALIVIEDHSGQLAGEPSAVGAA